MNGPSTSTSPGQSEGLPSRPFTMHEDMLFELSLSSYPSDVPNRWELIAARLCRRPDEVQQRYRDLLEDLRTILQGEIKEPQRWNDGAENRGAAEAEPEKKAEPRKSGVPWTPEEQMAFLRGLDACEKGDWKRISREFVRSKTATQVASHAQKYFQRQAQNQNEAEGTGRAKKRRSIHDLTLPSPRQDG
ncbi:hypothetical protein Cni_G05144 [Canna indica]|uniref:Uncharacterized protein n=1 Tax=Canna indica TaxID=4628 RepID=A0AAQ3JWN4_9LILI|nr:hypothetical protein Cni_G05144 [Canna indica]